MLESKYGDDLEMIVVKSVTDHARSRSHAQREINAPEVALLGEKKSYSSENKLTG